MRGHGSFNEFGERPVENGFTNTPTKGKLLAIRARLAESST